MQRCMKKAHNVYGQKVKSKWSEGKKGHSLPRFHVKSFWNLFGFPCIYRIKFEAFLDIDKIFNNFKIQIFHIVNLKNADISAFNIFSDIFLTPAFCWMLSYCHFMILTTSKLIFSSDFFGRKILQIICESRWGALVSLVMLLISTLIPKGPLFHSIKYDCLAEYILPLSWQKNTSLLTQFSKSNM